MRQLYFPRVFVLDLLFEFFKSLEEVVGALEVEAVPKELKDDVGGVLPNRDPVLVLAVLVENREPVDEGANNGALVVFGVEPVNKLGGPTEENKVELGVELGVEPLRNGVEVENKGGVVLLSIKEVEVVLGVGGPILGRGRTNFFGCACSN